MEYSTRPPQPIDDPLEDLRGRNLMVPRNRYGADGERITGVAGRPMVHYESGWRVADDQSGVPDGKVLVETVDSDGQVLSKILGKERLRTIQANFEQEEPHERVAEVFQGIGHDAAVFAGQPQDHVIEQYDEDGVLVGVNFQQQPAAMSGRTPDVQPQTAEQKQREIYRRLNELVAGLSNADVDALENYSRHLRDKQEAQQRGDGYGSELAGQYAGREYQAMTPAAQQIAHDFHHLRRQ